MNIVINKSDSFLLRTIDIIGRSTLGNRLLISPDTILKRLSTNKTKYKLISILPYRGLFFPQKHPCIVDLAANEYRRYYVIYTFYLTPAIKLRNVTINYLYQYF